MTNDYRRRKPDTCLPKPLWSDIMHNQSQSLAHLTLLVRDYDEALEFYTGRLNFRLVEDTPLAPGKRWILIAPPGSGGASLLLAKAATPEQTARIGDQAGGRVFLFLHTGHFDRDYAAMQTAGIEFLESPRTVPYGKVVVFRDLYGNKWDLIQPINL